MKRILTHLAIMLALLAIIGAASAGSQDSGNSTPINDTTNVSTETNVTVPINDTSGDQSNGTNETNVTNGTNTTIPVINTISISVLDIGGPGETQNQEYVKIANKGTTAVSLKDWTITDTGAVHTYLFPAYTLAAKSTVTLRSGVGTNTGNARFWNKQSFIWNNGGDTAYLYNSQGNLVSSKRTNGPTNGTNVTNGTSGTNGTNVTNGTSGTNGTNVTNGTSGTNGTNVTNGTNATVPPASTTPVIVPPKTIPGKIIPATVPIKVVVDEVKYVDLSNEGVQITALHPLSGGVEYVSITNFNDFTAHLEGYKIHEMECNNTIIFQDVKIEPGHTLKVYTGSHASGPDIASARKMHHIYNRNDTVELICACGNVISTFKK